MIIRMKKMISFFCLAILLILSACQDLPPQLSNDSSTPQPSVTATKRLPSPTIAITVTSAKRMTDTSTSTPTTTKTQTVMLSPDEAMNKTKTASVGCNIVPTPEVIQPVAGNESAFLIGRFVLCSGPGTETFDLDTGELGTYDVIPLFEWEERKYKSETDIMLYMGFNTVQPVIFTHNLTEINGAQVENADSDNLTMDECKKIIDKRPYFQTAHAERGDVVCVITNQGHFSIVRVESVDTYGWGSIEMSFTTWKQYQITTPTPLEN